LWLPAWAIGVLSIPSTPVNLGIGYTSWPWTTLLVIPVILALMAWATRLLEQRIRVILESGVFRPAQVLPPYLDDLVYGQHNYRFWVALALSAGVVAADLAPVVPTYFAGSPAVGTSADWKTAFTLSGGPTQLGNAWIVLVAFLIQGAASVLALTWIMHFALFLHRLLRLWPGTPAVRGHGYQLDPRAAFADPERRMGLRPLGTAINLFLLFAMLFGCYVVHHRLEVLRRAQNWSWSELAATCLRVPPDAASLVTIPFIEGWDMGTVAAVLTFLAGNAALLSSAWHVYRCRESWRQRLGAHAIRRSVGAAVTAQADPSAPPTASTTDETPLQGISPHAAARTDIFPNGRPTMTVILAWLGAQAVAALLPLFTGVVLFTALLFTVLVAGLAVGRPFTSTD
jgi:hypothetical protein